MSPHDDLNDFGLNEGSTTSHLEPVREEDSNSETLDESQADDEIRDHEPSSHQTQTQVTEEESTYENADSQKNDLPEEDLEVEHGDLDVTVSDSLSRDHDTEKVGFEWRTSAPEGSVNTDRDIIEESTDDLDLTEDEPNLDDLFDEALNSEKDLSELGDRPDNSESTSLIPPETPAETREEKVTTTSDHVSDLDDMIGDKLGTDAESAQEISSPADKASETEDSFSDVADTLSDVESDQSMLDEDEESMAPSEGYGTLYYHPITDTISVKGKASEEEIAEALDRIKSRRPDLFEEPDDEKPPLTSVEEDAPEFQDKEDSPISNEEENASEFDAQDGDNAAAQSEWDGVNDTQSEGVVEEPTEVIQDTMDQFPKDHIRNCRDCSVNEVDAQSEPLIREKYLPDGTYEIVAEVSPDSDIDELKKKLCYVVGQHVETEMKNGLIPGYEKWLAIKLQMPEEPLPETGIAVPRDNEFASAYALYNTDIPQFRARWGSGEIFKFFHNILQPQATAA
jgi:hypothetical protein